MKPLIFHFPQDQHLAHRLVEIMEAESGTLQWRRFPDGESLITIQNDCAGRDVLIVCTLTDPDAKTVPLHFAAATARELGAQRVGLVAPYLGYMRQDSRFQPGQARSAHLYAKLLSASFDWLITVDPHLHRIARLEEIFSMPAAAVSAMPAVSDWIATHVRDPVLVGPDRESAQWVERAARILHAPCVVLEKTRSGDRDVRLSVLDPAVLRGRNPVIIDDIASTGRTLAEAVKGLTPFGATDITCVVVHGLFVADAEAVLYGAGARRVVSTNTTPHPTNSIDVAPLIAAAIRHLLAPGRSDTA